MCVKHVDIKKVYNNKNRMCNNNKKLWVTKNGRQGPADVDVNCTVTSRTLSLSTCISTPAATSGHLLTKLNKVKHYHVPLENKLTQGFILINIFFCFNLLSINIFYKYSLLLKYKGGEGGMEGERGGREG